ncbi:pseudouridine synthase [Patescibacteria group bacterium]|nr:pseudouridine synthase [Patescibacteria group bacterium]
MLGLVSRRDAARAVKTGEILVDGIEAKASDMKISDGQVITFLGEQIEVRGFVYILLHKPAGYVCSELDEGGHHSYKMLLQDCPYAKMLHVAGRLDRDTEGLVFCTNDGNFTHEIISPKKKEEKEYYVELALPISDEDIQKLETGVTLDEGYVTMPAKAKRVSENIILLTIHEGKYHQVKRMAEAVNNSVTYLRRERIGEWTLEGLEKGRWKYLENVQ